MSLLSRFFYKRPPDGLIEVSERVYVFDSCFSTDVLPEEVYQLYLQEIITELHEEFPESSFLAFNFREGEKKSHFAEMLCEYDVTVMDYPRQYEGCPLLPLSLIHHFLRLSESWLSLDSSQNIVLIHCERGGWPLLAFVLASFLVFRKLHSGERKTLEMVYREGPRGLLQLLSPLNPFPSQLRYLQYVSRRNLLPEWPPLERPLSLDCLILRAIPKFDNMKGCRPIIRIFGRNLLSKDGLSTQMLYSMRKKGRHVRYYQQKDSDVIKIDIQCLVRGDVVLECLHLDLNPEREVMMFRIMFNTAFIRSNILMLNCDNLDILWDSKTRFPKSFRAEVLFGDVESCSPSKSHTTMLNGEEKGGLPIEAFSRVQELFNGGDWVDTNDDAAALWLLKQLSMFNDVKDLTMLRSKMSGYLDSIDSEEENNASSIADSLDFLDSEKVSASDINLLDDHSFMDSTTDEISDLRPSEIFLQPSISISVEPIQSVTCNDVEFDRAARSETSSQSTFEAPFVSVMNFTVPTAPPSPLSGGMPRVLPPPLVDISKSLPPLPPHEHHPPIPPSGEESFQQYDINHEENFSTSSSLRSSIEQSFTVLVPTSHSFPHKEISSKSPLSTNSNISPPPPPPPPPQPPPKFISGSNKDISTFPQPSHSSQECTPPSIGPSKETLTTPAPILPTKSEDPHSSSCLGLSKIPPPAPPPPPTPKSSCLSLSISPPPPPVPKSSCLSLSIPPPPPPPPPPSAPKSSCLSLSIPPPPPSLPPSKSSLVNSSNIQRPHAPAFGVTLQVSSSTFSEVSKSPGLLSISSSSSPHNGLIVTQPSPSLLHSVIPPPPPPRLIRGLTPTLTLAPTTNGFKPAPPPPPPLHSSVPMPPPPPPPPAFGLAHTPPTPPPIHVLTPTPPSRSLNRGLGSTAPPPPPPPPLTSGSVPIPPSVRNSIPTPPLLPIQGGFRPTPPPPPPPSSHSSSPSTTHAPLPNHNLVRALPPTPINGPPPPHVIPAIGHGSGQPPPLLGGKVSNIPPAPSLGRGRAQLSNKGRGSSGSSIPPKKASLKPLHWVKVTRAMQGSLWADSQKQESQSRAPEIDITELESLFSVVVASDGPNKAGASRGSRINKPEKVQLVDLRRAYNCEIMLTKIKIPLPDMINAVLALDSSALDIDQVENLIKFCPTKEEMEMLKNYNGDREMLGKCEQFFLELMKVPRVESKLRVFAFTITFSSQVEDLKINLNKINDASVEVKESMKLRQIMQTILTLGNALNQGTARGSAVGFKLDSLLKLSDTRARNNKMTLMHYLCKVIAEKLPELLDFTKDLVHLEPASKIQLKSLAEEMQAVSKGLEKVDHELITSENDGDVSLGFRKVLKGFLDIAEAEVRSLITLYSEVGRSADSLSQYFGEDPARFPFEQVTQILVVFTKMFNKAHEENEQQAEAEKRKLEKEALKEQAVANSPIRKEGVDALRAKLSSRNQKQPI